MSNIGNKKTMSENLNYYIESRNLDKRSVADDLGVRHSTFYSWCNGSVYPRIDKIEMLADYLHIDKMDLINEHDSKYEDKKIADLLFNNARKRELAYSIALMDDDALDKYEKMIDLLL